MSHTDDVITVGDVREPAAPITGAARPRRADKIRRTIASRRALQHRRRNRK